MTFDHIHFVFGGPIIFTIIGRLAFPIFAFFIGEGYKHTRNHLKYFLHLSIFAILLQIPAFFIDDFNTLNIFFILSAGLLCIAIFDKIDNYFIKFTLIICIAFLSQFFHLDYGAYGVFMILFIYIFKYSPVLLSLIFILLWFTFSFIFDSLHSKQFFSILALPILLMYNGKIGYRIKYLFYLYYPLHFCTIYLIYHFIKYK